MHRFELSWQDDKESKDRRRLARAQCQCWCPALSEWTLSLNHSERFALEPARVIALVLPANQQCDAAFWMIWT